MQSAMYEEFLGSDTSKQIQTSVDVIANNGAVQDSAPHIFQVNFWSILPWMRLHLDELSSIASTQVSPSETLYLDGVCNIISRSPVVIFNLNIIMASRKGLTVLHTTTSANIISAFLGEQLLQDVATQCFV